MGPRVRCYYHQVPSEDRQLKFEAPVSKVMPGWNPVYLYLGDMFLFGMGTRMGSSLLMEGSELTHLINQPTKKKIHMKVTWYL